MSFPITQFSSQFSSQSSSFSLQDIERECRVEYDVHRFDLSRPRSLGARVFVPQELWGTFPYNASAYVLMHALRRPIQELGTIEFPGLPLNPQNHTLAQRSPREHAYSSNPYTTDWYQSPHQDTPPHPTAFWLPQVRRYFATWVLSAAAGREFYARQGEFPEGDPHPLANVHRELVPRSLEARQAVLLNHEPGLLLLDNSDACGLLHARTAQHEAIAAEPDFDSDGPMYAFNEVGLVQYLRSLDERRGDTHLEPQEIAAIRARLQSI